MDARPRGADCTEAVHATIEVDPIGDGSWAHYATFQLANMAAYVHHEFPDAFRAHWVWAKSSGDAQLTAQFHCR